MARPRRRPRRFGPGRPRRKTRPRCLAQAGRRSVLDRVPTPTSRTSRPPAPYDPAPCHNRLLPHRSSRRRRRRASPGARAAERFRNRGGQRPGEHGAASVAAAREDDDRHAAAAPVVPATSQRARIRRLDRALTRAFRFGSGSRIGSGARTGSCTGAGGGVGSGVGSGFGSMSGTGSGVTGMGSGITGNAVRSKIRPSATRMNSTGVAHSTCCGRRRSTCRRTRAPRRRVPDRERAVELAGEGTAAESVSRTASRSPRGSGAARGWSRPRRTVVARGAGSSHALSTARRSVVWSARIVPSCAAGHGPSLPVLVLEDEHAVAGAWSYSPWPM